MAAVFSARRKLIRYCSKALGYTLGLLGVITGSSCLPPLNYSVPDNFNLTVQGKVMSAEDSTGIKEIHLFLANTDSSDCFSGSQTDSEGNYIIGMGSSGEIYWPDTLLLIADDMDGGWHGDFQDADTIIFAPYIGTSTMFSIDFYLQPEEEK